MNEFKLDSKTTALLVIDLQHGIVGLQTQPYPAQSIVEKAAGLVRVFRQMNGKVIFVRVDLADMRDLPVDVSHGNPNNPPPPIASELVLESGGETDDLVITKRHWSAFGILRRSSGNLISRPLSSWESRPILESNPRQERLPDLALQLFSRKTLRPVLMPMRTTSAIDTYFRC
jgi:nicotinamidase-related amidase